MIAFDCDIQSQSPTNQRQTAKQESIVSCQLASTNSTVGDTTESSD
jgi:hypothetical protein